VITKIFDDQFFLLTQKAGLNFKQSVDLIGTALKQSEREDHVAGLVERVILDKLEKARKNKSL
jgi:hypothetical protein